jgi:hypothetical protein
MQKIEKIANRLKNNGCTIIFAIVSSISTVDDLKINCTHVCCTNYNYEHNNLKCRWQ